MFLIFAHWRSLIHPRKYLQCKLSKFVQIFIMLKKIRAMRTDMEQFLGYFEKVPHNGLCIGCMGNKAILR